MDEQREHRELWVKALRSGKYEQTKGLLADQDGYCCLGVACEEYRQQTGEGHWEDNNTFVDEAGNTSNTSLPKRVMDWLGLADTAGRHLNANDERETLDTLNDDRGFSFEEIADVIEAEPTGLVT